MGVIGFYTNAAVVLGSVDIWVIIILWQQLNYQTNSGRKSSSFYVFAPTSMWAKKPTAGASSKQCSGWRVAVPNGDCCLSITVPGTASISASHVGATKESGKGCISISSMIQIWRISLSTAPSCGPILALPELPKKGWSSCAGLGTQPRRVQYQGPRERGWIGQPLALPTHPGATP